VIGYLNDATALDKGEGTLKDVRWEWWNYQEEYRLSGGRGIDVVTAWDVWYKDFMQTRIMASRDWLIKWTTDGISHWQGSPDALGQTAEAVCALYLDRAHEIAGFNSQGYPTGTPTAPP